MFGWYRAAHEIDRKRMQAVATRVLLGELDPGSARVRTELRRRSVRYHLEVDVAGYMSVFGATLADMYTDAMFVLLIRDCFSWLNSAVDMRIRNLHHPSNTHAYFHAKYGSYGHEFASEEAALQQAGLVPATSWLRSWAQTNQRVLDAIPSERLLVVRTEDLDTSAEVLAHFAGVPLSTVHAVHTNRNPSPTGLVSEVPVSFVVEQARRYCAPLMDRFWGPDWCDLATRLPRQRIS
jgi:hypothetical protein